MGAARLVGSLDAPKPATSARLAVSGLLKWQQQPPQSRQRLL